MTYRILAVGDFQGRASRGVQEPKPIHQRRPLEVDRDNLEERLSKLDVTVRLDSGEELTFRELEDFEPDSFVSALRSFDELRSMRRRLNQPATFDAAARELGALAEEARDEPQGGLPENAPGQAPEGIEMPEGLLSAALEQTEERAQEAAGGASMIESLARQWAAPFVVPQKDPRLPELLSAVDGGMQARARSVLQDAAFRGAESAWRGLDRLTRGLETGPGLKVEILDVTREELLVAGDSLRYFGGAGEAPPPNAVVLLHRFGADEEEMALLGSLAAAAASQGAILVADASPELVGAAGDRLGADVGDWEGGVPDALRGIQSAHGNSVVLVPNRMLMRLPYGKRGSSVEGFQLEEIDGTDWASAPWSSGAWAVAYALGVGQPEGVDLRRAVEIDRMPVALVDTGDGLEQIPCAEVTLGDSAIETLVSRGFTALRCARGADSIHVGPLVPLRGR